MRPHLDAEDYAARPVAGPAPISDDSVRSLTPRLLVVDCVRGLASLGVCLYHLSDGDLLSDGLLKQAGQLGWVGVEVFFVVSGFIIPWVLSRSDYRLSDFPLFVWKRVVRLDPPYLATILFILALMLASSGTLNVSVGQMLAHLAYANVLFDFEWLNPVFWTLAIEFQYYVLIGLAYPVLRRLSIGWLLSTATIVFLLAVAIPNRGLVFHFLPIFYLGVVAFYIKSKLLPWVVSIPLLLGVAVGAVVAVGHWQGRVALATALIIALTNLSWRPLAYLGTISYSLYLLHSPLGNLVLHLARRFLPTTENFRTAGLFAAVSVCIAGAHVFHRLVEHPAQKWSRRIGRRRALQPASGVASEH